VETKEVIAGERFRSELAVKTSSLALQIDQDMRDGAGPRKNWLGLPMKKSRLSNGRK
jgi:hypothetical protein